MPLAVCTHDYSSSVSHAEADIRGGNCHICDIDLAISKGPERIRLTMIDKEPEFGGTEEGTQAMRVLIICATLITVATGLGGCWWHHQAAVVTQPLPPMKPLKLATE
jgi:hypothetical protein